MFRLFLLTCFSLFSLPIIKSAVTVTDSGTTVTLTNNLISFVVTKSSATITAFHLLNGNINLMGATGYFDAQTDGDVSITSPVYKLERSSTSLAEISLSGTLVSSTNSSVKHFDLSLHYVLRDNEAGWYVFPVWTHGSGDAAVTLSQSRYVLRVNQTLFTESRNDDNHYATMPLPQWLTSDAEIMDETYHLPDGTFYTKYEWTKFVYLDSVHGEYGKSGSNYIGIWTIPGSYEASYGPTHAELILHQTSSTPVALTAFQGSHYSYQEFSFTANEKWNKLHGPSFYYVNSGTSSDAIWSDAKSKASSLASSWPYDWMNNTYYPLKAQRGSAKGTVSAKVSVTNGWAILAEAGLTSWRPDWQNKNYNFWSMIDSSGTYNIQNVIPGTYDLYIWIPTQFPTGKVSNVQITANQVTSVQTVTLTDANRCSLTGGSTRTTIWQIGVPDHSSGEYKHGDDYHHWGMWQNYLKEFPNGCTYTIGTSTERNNWNYVQPLVSMTAGAVDKSTWTVNFNVTSLTSLQGGNACLTIGVASNYAGEVHTDYGLNITMNGNSIAKLTQSSESALVRVGIEGVYNSYSYPVKLTDLKTTSNILTLLLSGTTTTPQEYMPNAGLMYDFLILEGMM